VVPMCLFSRRTFSQAAGIEVDTKVKWPKK